MVASIVTIVPFALVRLDSKVHSTVVLKINNLVETLSTIVYIACVNGSVSHRLVVPDHGPKRGNLVKLAANMTTFELAFKVVEVHVIVQRAVG